MVSASEEPTPGFNQRIPEKIMTPDSVDTPSGTLEFFDGMPTAGTLTKVYVNLDLWRGALGSWRCGEKHGPAASCDRPKARRSAAPDPSVV